MNRDEWLACRNSLEMVNWLLGPGAACASERKKRLLTCALVRTRWDLVVRQHCVETAERFADGACTAAELEEAFLDAKIAPDEPMTRQQYALEMAARYTCHYDVADVLSHCNGTAYTGLGEACPVWLDRLAGHADLVHCLVGVPWIPVRATGAERVAKAIYGSRDFDSLPVLADALEDAGCGDADLLGHLRGPGPHALGCWALDAALGYT